MSKCGDVGVLVDLQAGVVTAAERDGVFVAHETFRLKRLSLGAHALLYLSVVGDVTEADAGPVPPGAYQVAGTFSVLVRRKGREFRAEELFPQRYLVVESTTARFVSEVEVFKALGACEALLALGLGDAAISLELGDLTNARYQWLRARDGL